MNDDTPFLELELAALERNVGSMADAAATGGLALRPHAKTHKSAYVAHLQRSHGAAGIACAKLAEAERFAACGIDDLLVTSEIVDSSRLARAAALASYASLIVTIDDLTVIDPMDAAAKAAGVALDVLVSVDVGQRRSGVSGIETIGALAERLVQAKGLRFAGLQAYDGHVQYLPSVDERDVGAGEVVRLLETIVDELCRADLTPRIVTTGGTGSALFYRNAAAVTEIQPGSYVLMDGRYGAVSGVAFEQALHVVASVISRRLGNHEVVLDAGYKAITPEYGVPEVVGHPGARVEFRGDEHIVVGWVEGLALPQLGDRIWLLPSHCDTTVNLYDEYVVVRDGRRIARWPVLGRGSMT